MRATTVVPRTLEVGQTYQGETGQGADCKCLGQGGTSSQAPQLISVAPSSICPTRVGTAASTAMIKARKKNRIAFLCYIGSHNLAMTAV